MIEDQERANSPALPKREDLSSETVEPIAVRLNALDMTRATEQTALFMALLTSEGVRFLKAERDKSEEAQEKQPRKKARLPRFDGKGYRYAAAAMYGYLGHIYCSGLIIHPDTLAKKGEGQKLRDELHRRDGRFGLVRVPNAGGAEETGWELELIATPVDGLSCFLEGMNEGAISALAGGPPGSFIAHPESALAERYLVITARSRLLAELHATGLRIHSKREQQTCVASGHVFDEAVIGPLLAANPKLKRLTFSTALTYPDDVSRVVLPVLRTHAKVRAFNGSSIAAGLCPWYPSTGIDASVVIARRTHAFMLAVAAVARGGDFVAIPIDDVHPDKAAVSIVLSKSDIVAKDADIFFVATGVSETSILEGVRFLEHGVAATHSLCLRTRSHSSRFVRHHQDRDMPFRFLRREHVSEVVQYFEAQHPKVPFRVTCPPR